MEQNEQKEKIRSVFISHSNKSPDAEICEHLYKHLNNNKICCWMDREDMHHGDWREQIVKNLLNASAFILVASENSLISAEVMKEIELMTKTKRPLILFSLDDFYSTLDERKGAGLYELGAGSKQAVFLKDYQKEEEALDKLMSYLPHDITRLKNNPVDFIEKEGVLLKYKGHDRFVEIPSYIREIGEDAFLNNGEMVSVKIPDSVQKIGRRAFFGCSSLSQVDGMNGVKEVHASAFTYARVAPEGSRAFVINGVLFGKEVGEDGKLPAAAIVAQNAFRECATAEIEFEEGLETVGVGAFADSYELQRITFPATLKEIGEKAFSGCDSLREVVFKGSVPENVKEIFKTAKIKEEK